MLKPKRREGMVVGNRKSFARNIRKDVTPLQNADGSHSTHVMASGDTNSKKYKYEVNPTVFPNDKKGKSWTDLRDNPREAYSEARKRGEVIGFKSAKRAEKFSYGSWKERGDRKEAMKEYRSDKRAGKLYTQSSEFKNQRKNK